MRRLLYSIVLALWFCLPWISTSGYIHSPRNSERILGWFVWLAFGLFCTVLVVLDWRRDVHGKKFRGRSARNERIGP